MMKNRKRSQNGVTLVEFIVIAFILVTISGIIVGVIYSVFRGSSRSHETVKISSNGNYALSVITSHIVSARGVLQVGGSTGGGRTGGTGTESSEFISCTTPRTGSSIKLRAADGGELTFACQDDSIASLSASLSEGVSLIDSFELQVVPGTCSFTCTQNSIYEPPLIKISFDLESRKYLYETDRVRESFQSSASLRNYSY